MSGGSLQGSPGATQPHYSALNVPRRSSYASVAAGTSAGNQQVASVHLPPSSTQATYSQLWPDQQSSRIPRPVTVDADMSTEERTRLPETWGSGTKDTFSDFSSSTFAKHIGTPTEILLGSGGNDGFFKPTYLRGSKYLDDLEAAYQAALSAEEKQESSPNRNGHGPLSKSPSNASLPKMQASHRGMSYEIIEREPQLPETGPGRLPSRWAIVDRYNCLEMSQDGQQVRFSGAQKLQDNEAPAARADFAMPAQAGIYYYEVTVISRGKDGMIGIGFSSAKVSSERLPGWEPESWAYHGDDGKSFCCHVTGRPFGPTYSTDDTIGCGLNFTDRSAFFTKNGNLVGSPFKDIPTHIDLFPAVGMKRPYAHLVTNFGARPFVFDIDTYVERKRQELHHEINATSLTSLHPTLNRDDLSKALVAQYLSHDGYVETAQAFAQEVRRDNVSLKGNPESPIENYLAKENDQGSADRQLIRAAVLDGDIETTLHLTNSYFPTVLEKDPVTNFRIRCLKFIELMREAGELHQSPMSTSSKPSTFPNGHSAPTGGKEERMDVDEPPVEHQDRYEKMEAAGGARPDTYDEVIGQAIACGQELNAEFSQQKNEKLKELFQETLKELFGMLAFKDPRKSPAAKWLEMSERVKVAEALNSAILVSMGKSSSTALELMYKQAVTCTDLISQDGGPGCLINVRNLLKPSASSSSSSSSSSTSRNLQKQKAH